MIYLPNRVVHAPEDQQNFEYLETILSQVRFADATVAAAVSGVSAKKLQVLSTTGQVIGYVPVYPE